MPGYLLAADLHVQVSDAQGQTDLRVSGESGALVVDVDDPAILLAALLAGRPARRYLVKVPAEVASATVRITSHGRQLGRFRLIPGRRIRISPSAAGVLVALRLTTSGVRRRAASIRRG